MTTNSIRFQTTVLYSGILCLILLCFSFYLYHSVKRILYQNIDEELILKADQIVGTINAYGEFSKGRMPPTSLMRKFLSDDNNGVSMGQGVIEKLWDKHRWLLGANNNFYRVVGVKGEVVLQSEDLPSGTGLLFDKYLSLQKGDNHYASLRINGAAFRGIAYPFTFDYRQPCILQLVVPLNPVEHTLSRLSTVMALGIGTILILSLFIGSFLTWKVLRPVMEVTRTARQISQKNLSVRIKEGEMDQEMRLLVSSFNQMIGRLEKSFAHINEFSSHVAHELKTPLTIIKGELELALSAENVHAEDRQAMETALQEIDRLIRIIKDLLLLAKFDYSPDLFNMEPMDLTGFLEEVYRHSKVLASEKDIGIDLDGAGGPVWVSGDPTHLRRLFFNLIHNAVKFTPPGGKIQITVQPAGPEALVHVKDNGEGIAPDCQARIFEKFYRGHRKEGEGQPGTGLGLCMARSIARAHGGDIVFESALGQGSTFTVKLPLAPDRKRPG